MRRLAILLAVLPAPSFASTTILSGDDGREARACYEAAETEDVERGLAHCDAAIAGQQLYSPNLVASHVNRGILLTKARRFQAAMEDFNQALALKPGKPEAYANRGNLYLLRGRPQAAIADYTRAIEGNCTRLFAVYYGRGLAYEAQERTTDAIADFKAALALNPDFMEAREALAFYRAPA